VRVHDADGRPHLASTYRVLDKGEHRPTRLYLDKILRWGARWELPGDYLARLRSVATRD